MKKLDRSLWSKARPQAVSLLSIVPLLILSTAASAQTTLLVNRDGVVPSDRVAGVVAVTIEPGFEDATVSLAIDGQQLTDRLHRPYRLSVDFGADAVEHTLLVSAVAADGRRTQWKQMINSGAHPLSIRIRRVDGRLFEVDATAPTEDPIESVAFWDRGTRLVELTEAPYRFEIPANHFGDLIQVTAHARSGEEVADFWSAKGSVQVESLEVRNVPIYVSVVNPQGQATDRVDASLFRIRDNDTEGRIVEFGKAYDQPLSIALLIDASGSMTYAMKPAVDAARTFVERILTAGDRCSVTAVRDVPRRIQPLTGDRRAVLSSLAIIDPRGQTALFDALESAIRELSGEKNRRAIVVLTDGGDTSSMASFDELDRDATEAGIPIYFIAYATGQDTELKDVDRMQYLAGQTGGFVVQASKENLSSRYEQIEMDLRSQFAIVYQVADFAKHHEWRKIQVSLKSPTLSARTIRGYYAP